MKSIEIESWALRILEQVENHLPVEDSRVELKADRPDPVKTAREVRIQARLGSALFVLENQ